MHRGSKLTLGKPGNVYFFLHFFVIFHKYSDMIFETMGPLNYLNC